MVNARTGEVQGDRPYSWKIFLFCAVPDSGRWFGGLTELAVIEGHW
jgi:hypothetical protein